jgi:predicted nuclease with TOPRIM domain
LEQGETGTLTNRKPGRKPTRDPNAVKLQQLERENARLNRKLKQAETIIEVQKKLSELLGIPLDEHPKADA